MSSNIKHNLHNTHSWNRLLHRFKGHLELAVRCEWWGILCRLSAQEVQGWCMCVSGGGGVFGHCSVTQTQCSESSKFTKHQNSSFSIVMQYTCWHDLRQRCQVFSRVFLSSLAVKGLGPGRVEDFTPLLAVAFQGGWHRFSTLLPCVRGAEEDVLRLGSVIRRCYNSSASAVFDQTSYLGVTSHFTKLTRLKQKALSEFIFVTCLFKLLYM